MKLFLDSIDSPVGRLAIVAHEKALCALHFGEADERLLVYLRRRFGDAELIGKADPLGAVSRLRAYFGGEIHALDDLPADCGGTAFQQRVWSALREIPVGATTTYGELARRIGTPQACRAVGLANGSNPIAIVVPCHRVIGSNGTLTGYGGGLERKRWLLELEGARLPFGAFNSGQHPPRANEAAGGAAH